MASEYITQERMFQINFYGLMYSVMNTIYATIILLFSFKDKNGMYQKQFYFFGYMGCWGIGVTQIAIYALCHNVFTGINYSQFHHSRDMTNRERRDLAEIDEYLVGLSDSSEGRNEDSGESRTVAFDDMKHLRISNYIRLDKNSEEFCSV